MSLCMRHDLAAAAEREREREKRKREVFDDDEEEEEDDRIVKKPTLGDLVISGPPLHRRVLEVRKELEQERRERPTEIRSPLPVDLMISQVAEREDDMLRSEQRGHEEEGEEGEQELRSEQQGGEEKDKEEEEEKGEGSQREGVMQLYEFIESLQSSSSSDSADPG